jgi:glycosyltransferase involved in cell wall biosynthesis
MLGKLAVVHAGYYSGTSYDMATRDRRAFREWGSDGLRPLDHIFGLTARATNKLFKLDQVNSLPRHCDTVVIVHERGYRALAKILPGFVRYIPKGVDIATIDRNRPSPSGASSRSEVLFIGMIYHRKGIFDLIEAFHLVRESLPQAHLTIIGSGPTEMVEQLQLMVRQYSMTEAVTVLGSVGYYEKIRHLWKCDVFCLPSYMDSFPSVTIEAMACGKPVVTTYEADTRVIKDCSGLRVHAGDIHGMARAVRLLLQDESLRTKMGSAARATAEANDWKHAAGCFAEIYRELAT